MSNTNPDNTVTKGNREELEKLLDKAIRPAPAPLPEVTTEAKDLDFISYVPLDKKKYPNYIEAFGRRITESYERNKTTDEEGRAIITYTTKAGSGELRYSFDEDLLVRELGKDATKKLPTLGRRASNLWYSMIYFAKEQGNGVEGNFTASELMRLWGIDDPSKGGRAFKDIRETFFNIVAVMPSYTNNRSGDERLDWGFAFTSSYLIKGEGREARYYYTMTPEALGLTEKWLKGELTAEEIKIRGGYLAYPLEYLQSGLDETEQNFRDYLLKFKGGYTVKAHTILTDWLKLRKDLIRRRKYCHELLYRYLENAKKRGEISSYKFEVRELKEWRKKWTVTVYKPVSDNKTNKARVGNSVSTAEQEELINTIFEWQNRPVQGIRTPPNELKQQIANTVRSYGVEPVREIYERTALGAKPSTYDFWQEVKELKQQNHKTTSR
jgi:hypothetical protein